MPCSCHGRSTSHDRAATCRIEHDRVDRRRRGGCSSQRVKYGVATVSRDRLAMVLAGRAGGGRRRRAGIPLVAGAEADLPGDGDGVDQPVAGRHQSDLQRCPRNQQLTQTYGRLITSGPVLEQAGASFDLSFDEMREMVSVSTSDEPQLIDITARNEDPTWRRGSPTKPPAFSPSRSRQRRLASRRRSRTPTSSVRS